jgi:uncharacterized protein YjbI with pentapeptide repeats
VDLEQTRPRKRVNWPEITSLITAVTAIGALVFTAISLRDSRDQLGLTAQGQFTDRYSRAIEQLGQQGPDRLQIRLGGIYALERLGRDSTRDQPTIVEVLTTFVRTNTPAHPERGCPPSSTFPVADVQAALTVLARRDSRHDNGAEVSLGSTCLTGANLHDADLANPDLTKANLTRANLLGADLRDADLANADLTGANLTNADLRFALVTDADLPGAHLVDADLRVACLDNANLTSANLPGANLTRTNLGAANLTHADFTDANLTHANLSGADLGAANLDDANLNGVNHDNDTDVRGVRTNAHTKGTWW